MAKKIGKRLPPDPFQGEEWDAFVRSVIDGPESLTRKIYTSAVGISLVPDEATGTDVKFAIELGFMVMYDKPILAIVTPGQKISKKLEQIADKIIYADVNKPGASAKIAKEIQVFLAEHKENEDGS